MASLTCADCQTEISSGSEAEDGSCPVCGGTLNPTIAKAAMATVVAPPPQPRGAATPPVPSFDVAEYQATSGSTTAGIFAMLGAGLVAAGVVGLLASLVGQCFYLVILFPIGFGLAVGFPMAYAGKLAKVHSGWISALIGLWCGIVTMVVMHFTDYILFTLAMPPGVDLSFLGFMDMQATEGVEIGGRTKGINLGYTGTVIYWLLEIGVVAICVAGLGFAQALEPFCLECDRWKEAKTFGPFHAPVDRAKGLVEAGRVGELSQLAESTDSDDKLQLTIAICPGCKGDGDVDVRLQHLVPSKDGESTSEICHITYPGAALKLICGTLGANAK